MILRGRLIKIVSSIFLMIGIFINLACAKNNDEIIYSPNWVIGESASYTLVQKSTKNNYFATSHVNIKVIEKTKSGYVLEWKAGDVEISPEYKELPMETQALLDASSKIIIDQVVRYKTNNNGTFQEIVNVDEIRNSANRSLDIIVNGLPEDPDKEKFKDVRQKMMQDDSVIKNPSKELASLHSDFICGRAFHIGQKYSAEVQMPNIFDPSLPFEGTISLMASHDGNVTTYRISSIFGVEEITKNTSSMLGKLSGTNLSDSKLKEFEQAVQGSELVDSYNITILDGENWIEQCSFERKATIQGKTVRETFVITRERGETNKTTVAEEMQNMRGK